MNYFIDLFSPETARAFEQSNRDVSGFRISQKHYVEKQNIGPGDKFICYVTRIQRFVGVLEVKSKYFKDDTPIFDKENDPFMLRFNVKPIVWLPLEKAIPIDEDVIWKNLSFTRNLEKGDRSYTHMLFASPRLWPKEACIFLERTLLEQAKKLTDYPFTEDDEKKLRTTKIRISSKKEVSVSVPEDEEIEHEEQVQTSGEVKRESIKIQAKLAEIGEKLGMKIWLPRNDRVNVLQLWQPKEGALRRIAFGI